MTELSQEIPLFAAASAWVARVVTALPESAWEHQGLGGWNMRALVGHTSRALLTVEQNAETSASLESVRSAEEYYERVANLPGVTDAAVFERGVAAGRALGASPKTEFAAIAERVPRRIARETDRLISTLAGGMLLSSYLPTRTFELVVHGLDITRAAGLNVEPPGACLDRALKMSLQLSLCAGTGAPLLMALTGRETLPPKYSVIPTPAARPNLDPGLSEAEFLRWYWLKAELEAFARTLGIRASGSKELLAARIGAALAGRVFQEPSTARPAAGRQLSGPLTPETIIPEGQRSSQVVRAWMLEQIGVSFHFDAPMREFFAASDGTKTMQDAVDHYRSTRDQGRKHIDDQYEYNRFTRAWHQQHPTGARDELLAAWRTYRETPTDQRGRI